MDNNVLLAFTRPSHWILKFSPPTSFLVVVSILLIPPSSSFSLCQTRNKYGQNGKTVWTRIRAKIPSPSGNDEDDIPSMDWLTDTLSKSDDDMADSSPYIEEHSVDGDLGDVPIPTTGLSVADEMGKVLKDRFYTEIVPITGLAKGVKASRILSSTAAGEYEAVRYLVRLSREYDNDDDNDNNNHEDNDDDEHDDENDNKINGKISNAGSTPYIASSEDSYEFVMIDVPPFSEKLVKEMKSLMGHNGRLSAILVTSRDCIHYDDAPGVFTIRKADLTKWGKAFPETATIAYRMDIPRDCRESITQRLDGYGPWAMREITASNSIDNSCLFKETGLPFTVKEWDPEIAQEILAGKRKPPGEEEDENGNDNTVLELDENGKYPPEAIRANEEGKRILAVYTPGRSYGSMTYVFPELDLCASGFSIPLEDSRDVENRGMDSAGPALDHRGYITTSKAGMSRQTESAKKFVNTYVDRFDILLTARGDPFFLDENTEDRRKTLLGIMDQYEKLGNIYERLGIGPN